MVEQKLIITRPDDMHLHLRDSPILEGVIGYSTKDFGRAIIMPNLSPPITTIDMLNSYRRRIELAVPETDNFKPLMTLYLTENIDSEELRQGVSTGVLTALKLYPAGATTNSKSGVRNISKCYKTFETMIDLDLPLLIHGEVTDPEVDIFDRESIFISSVLDPLRRNFPELRIVLEHITTIDSVQYIKEASKNLFATITPHHLVLNRNDIFNQGINPHNYCLPILKRESHRLALINAATSGDRRFFLGTDSAPHYLETKETSCGCAGIFNSINTLGVLASVFEEHDSLGKLELFTSVHGAKFYKLEENKQQIVLRKRKNIVNKIIYINVLDKQIKVFDPVRDIFWEVETGAEIKI